MYLVPFRALASEPTRLRVYCCSDPTTRPNRRTHRGDRRPPQSVNIRFVWWKLQLPRKEVYCSVGNISWEQEQKLPLLAFMGARKRVIIFHGSFHEAMDEAWAEGRVSDGIFHNTPILPTSTRLPVEKRGQTPTKSDSTDGSDGVGA